MDPRLDTFLTLCRTMHYGRAAEALKNTPGAVAEIAADCGFADSNYFARKFRAAYGVSPREFRKRPL